MRLKDKIAIVVGAGQSPGEGLGNGRATVLRFAQEGAKALAVDNNLASAEETVAIARQQLWRRPFTITTTTVTLTSKCTLRSGMTTAASHRSWVLTSPATWCEPMLRRSDFNRPAPWRALPV